MCLLNGNMKEYFIICYNGYGFLLLPSLCTEALVLGPHRLLAELSTAGELHVCGIIQFGRGLRRFLVQPPAHSSQL